MSEVFDSVTGQSWLKRWKRGTGRNPKHPDKIKPFRHVNAGAVAYSYAARREDTWAFVPIQDSAITRASQKFVKCQDMVRNHRKK